ncbi:hypothetical protein M433DRAFT_158365 [Acidomyces richmondensis BFW]|nr:MAG: hypothetical protein FE78DRAFT_104183 [Acidomyces sp. 'richmondensis']KYG42033.1 hypothetical protein M433DRAFT_158365 [Acidomyces richmondensis BFW]
MGVGEWDGTSANERFLSHAMEAYAGMLDSLNANVDKVIDYRKTSGANMISHSFIHCLPK